ncbi:MAG TPA: serine hydrolase [Candidatus Saccharimonadales bacterium]|jgi:beta-lactamase class A
MSNHSEVPVPGEAIDLSSLSERLQTVERRARRLGVRVRALVVSGDQQIEKQADQPMFAASLGKLPLADMVIEQLDSDELIDVEALAITHPRTGERIEKQSVGDLLECMLKHSSNVAYRVLAERLGGSAEIQGYYAHHGWHATSVLGGGPTGRALIGETSPVDALDQLGGLLAPDTENGVLPQTAVQSLRDNAVKRYGIRRVVPPNDEVQIWNKTGEYNGDLVDPWAYRHDVGRVTGPDGTIDYALMTSTTPRKKVLADLVVGRMTAEVAASAGGPRACGVGRHILRLLR